MVFAPEVGTVKRIPKACVLGETMAIVFKENVCRNEILPIVYKMPISNVLLLDMFSFSKHKYVCKNIDYFVCENDPSLQLKQKIQNMFAALWFYAINDFFSESYTRGYLIILLYFKAKYRKEKKLIKTLLNNRTRCDLYWAKCYGNCHICIW